MKKYLTTGVIVQAFIIVLRRVLGKSKGVFKENKSKVSFWFALVFGCIANILAWPVAVVCEIIYTKDGI